MSLYHYLFLWLLLCVIVEHLNKKTPKRLYLFTFVLLTVLLCIRFGQGTDYFSYAAIYRAIPPDPIQALEPSWIHAEPGWKILCSLFRIADVPFTTFVVIHSLYMMGMFFRFIRLYGGERKMLALLLCFHTLYLTYFASLLRQAVVVATLLGILLPLLMKRRYFKYFLIAALLTQIHTVALTLFLLPIIQNIDFKFAHCVALAAIGILVGAILSFIDFGVFLQDFVDIDYLVESKVSIFALLERILTFGIVTFCYYTYQQAEEPDKTSALFTVYKVYAFGIFLYGLLMWSPLISSRTGYLLKVVELILICGCLDKCKKAKTVILLYFMLLSSVLYVKNINSYLDQGDYENTTVLDFPYVTVFNQEDILNYRQHTFDYPFK